MFQWGNVSLLYLYLHRKTEIPWRWELHSVLNISARPSSLIRRRMVDPYHYPDWRFVGVFSERLNKQRRITLNVGSTFSKLGLHPGWKGGRQLGTSFCLFLLPYCGYNVTLHSAAALWTAHVNCEPKETRHSYVAFVRNVVTAVGEERNTML